MSQSLAKSFDRMKIAPVPNNKLKLALPDLETHGRVCFYGFAVTMKWLVDYVKLHWDDADNFDDLAKASTAITFLRKNSRISTLQLETALLDSTAPTETTITPGHRPGEPMVPLIAICTDEKSSYSKRPSQAQVDALSLIMGKQPRWWVDYEDPRSYEY